MSRTSTRTWKSPTVRPRSSPEFSLNSEPWRILGVDPGSRATGWGLLGGRPRCPVLLECGVIRLPAAGDLAQRMACLQLELADLLARLRPTGAAVEAPFHGKDSRAALHLAHARGVICAGLAAWGLAVAEYSPATVKKSVTGNGRAPKEQVQRMVRQLLGSPDTPPSRDLSDALAVALCHVATHGHRAALARAAAVTPLGKP